MKSPRAIVISGNAGAGKSTLACRIADELNAKLIKSFDLILQIRPRTTPNRVFIDRVGNKLDKETNGKWIAEALGQYIVRQPTNEMVVIDSVESAVQVEALRRIGWAVTHIHLKASEKTIYSRRSANYDNSELGNFSGPTNRIRRKNVDNLKNLADTVIDTERCSSEDVYCRVIARLNARPLLLPPTVDVLVGGQYGSEGKGNIADYLAPDYDVLVRVGSVNAGHKVYRAGGKPYTFRQLPSGTLGNPDATIVLGAGTVIGLDVLLREISELSISISKLIIDPNAIIISNQDKEKEEKKLKLTIGSTAQGVGQATARKILHRYPSSQIVLAKDSSKLKHYVHDTVDYFAECYAKGKNILLEGTQGTSLSLHHGTYPWVTSRMTTADACLAEAGLASRYVRRIVMVCRTYPIRVGNSLTGETSGPMRQEITFEEIAKRARLPAIELNEAEKGSVSGRGRRVAEFDWLQLRRSLLLNGPTDLALTFADYIDVENRKAYRYEQLTTDTLRFIEELENVSGIPVSLISTKFDDRSIIDRRKW